MGVQCVAQLTVSLRCRLVLMFSLDRASGSFVERLEPSAASRRLSICWKCFELPTSRVTQFGPRSVLKEERACRMVADYDTELVSNYQRANMNEMTFYRESLAPLHLVVRNECMEEVRLHSPTPSTNGMELDGKWQTLLNERVISQ